MKIALVRQRYTPFGGAERYMSRLIDGLVAQGHDVHVFASHWGAGENATVSLHKVPVVRLSGWLKALTFSLNCRRLLRRENFDIIFSLERTLFQTIYRAGDGCHRQWLVQKNLGKGALAKLLTYANPFQLAYLYLERKLFTDRDLKAIIANSRSGKEEIMRLYGVPEEKIHVVYNGIDPDEFDVGGRERMRAALAREFGLNDELRLLYVGSGFKRKGVPVLLRAAARLKMPFKLFVVGKGDVASFARTAGKLGIADRVIFTGPRKDVETFYVGCDAFVFPTLYDPFSNATLEAMACGLPVITSRYNGVAELIEDGRNGFVVNDPLDGDAIAAAIGKLADADARRRMGEMAASTARHFTMARNSSETLKVIAEVMGRNGAQQGGTA